MLHARTGRRWAIAGAAFAVSLLAFGLSEPAGAMVTPRLKPPAPGPDYLSQSDYEALKNVESAIDRRDWRAAHDAADAVVDATAKGLADWLDLYAGDPTVDFSAVGAFLDAHKDWPALAKFQSDAERRIPSDAATQSVIDFFKTRDPLTGEGKLALARAEFAQGEKDAAVLHIRSAWINDDFRLADEQRLISRYGGFLTEEDQNARVDRLLWEREVTAARRVFSRLSPRNRRMAEARA
ncbi:MAG TPA: hypothetical protein VNH64_04165, partial [Parvularculaceae bacterium]|nr:hypothetical protein [Parvularculaceae bacterium]